MFLLLFLSFSLFRTTTTTTTTNAALVRVQKPPKQTQTNCKPACPSLSVPSECGYVGTAKDLMMMTTTTTTTTSPPPNEKRRVLLASGSSLKSLKSRRRRSSSFAGKKGGGGGGKSRGQSQPFAPPSNEFIDVLRANLRYWRELGEEKQRCGLWTLDCVKNYWPEDKIHMNITREITHPRHPFLRLFVGNKVPAEEKWANFFRM